MKKMFLFYKRSSIKKTNFKQGSNKIVATVRWHMAEEILIAVIFVEFQRQVGQLALQNSGQSVGK